MSNLSNEPNLSLCISCFNGIFLSAATIHIGKRKPTNKSKARMTPHVRAKISTRNCLRRTIHQNQQEWIDAYREAIEAIDEANTESWKDFLQDAISNSYSSNIWKVIQVLNGTPDVKSPNETMSHDGRTITDIKSKSNVFINHYTRVSKLNMS